MNQNFFNLFVKSFFRTVYKKELSISGGSGMSIQDAIIMESEVTDEAVKQEYTIINGLFAFVGGDKKFEIKSQSLLEENGRYYDQIIASLEGMGEYHFYFDITKAHTNMISSMKR